MKIDLHIHTSWCDGADSSEEMVLAAIEKGLDRIGICTHAAMPFPNDWCIEHEKYGEFQKEIACLKEKYKDKIDVLCGVEQDMLSEAETDGFDYVIGSVHCLKVGNKGNEYISVDESPESFKSNCDEYFGGDYFSFAESYYESVARVAEKTGCDIIGHFDLVTKFNEGALLFDENNPRYVAAWKAAADELLKAGKPFEINTGAISRGYRTSPYPTAQIIRYIRENGGRLFLSSDAHSKETVAFEFEKYGG